MDYPSMFGKRRSKLAVLCIVSVALVSSSRSFADDDAERENLARISYELTQLQRMIGDAAATADHDGRARFRYDLLARDVSLVQSGIDDHLQRPRQPQRVQPLAGDYRNY